MVVWNKNKKYMLDQFFGFVLGHFPTNKTVEQADETQTCSYLYKIINL